MDSNPSIRCGISPTETHVHYGGYHFKSAKLGCGKSKTDSPVHTGSAGNVNQNNSKMAEKGGRNTMLFPAPNSQQRQGGTEFARKKVTLKPGRSLLDWIRLGRSGADLTGVGGQTLQVTREELAKHSTVADAWMAIRGKVYNITPYMEYHPGGQDELMRGAGIDGTALFDEIHKWVNAESMLEKCLVGHLLTESPVKRGSLGSRPNSRTSSIKTTLSVNGPVNTAALKPPDLHQPPTYDWFQSSSHVTIVVYTRWKHIQPEHVDIDRSKRELLIMVTVDIYMYRVHLNLQDDITSDIVVHTHQDSGKVEIILPKMENKQWPSLGKPQPKDKSYLKSTDSETVFRECRVVSVTEVTHDTKLFCIAPPENCRHCIPIGHHVHIRHSIEGMEITRSYTAVLLSLFKDHQDPLTEHGQAIYLMIKIYPGGTLTPWIGTLSPGDPMSVSESDGRFNLSQLSGVTHLILIAAGTGFTPMVRLIYHTIVTAPADNKMQVQLLFYNKIQRDIMWRKELESLAAEHDRFQVTHILSGKDETWEGLTGHISKEHVETFVPVKNGDTIPLACVCGPLLFVELAVDHLKSHGLTEDQVYTFMA